MKSIITQIELLKRLHYNPDTGVFTWKTRDGSVKIGSVAGTRHRTGYIHIAINGKDYKAHRLAWLYVYDYFPSNDIDHINRVKNDNRISNLREATRSQNCVNSTQRKDGLKWAYFNAKTKRWVAKIKVKQRIIHLGTFDTEIEAYKTAYRKILELYGDFAPTL